MSKKSFGKLPPRYHFFLNPYSDLRFTRCPKCSGKTGQRKLPLLIWVEPTHPISLNYTHRYCPRCDLLIAHQDQIEANLFQIFEKHNAKLIGNPYLVLGTMEKSAWKQGVEKPLDAAALPEWVHDFIEVLKFELNPGWEIADEDPGPASSQPGVDVVKETVPVLPGAANSIIDRGSDAIALAEKIKAHLPIPARPVKELVNLMRKQGVFLDRYRDVKIKQVFYTGDEGGILCDITPAGQESTPVLCSITHLVISEHHPLAAEIRAYQEQRAKNLGADFGLKSTSITPKKP